jgi:hypothetical protein
VTHDPRWTIDVEDANDLTLNAWTRVASGRSRVRAVCVFLICSFARPGDVHRLYWRTHS